MTAIKYAEIILPLPLRGTFTYKIPQAFVDEIQVGYRAIVPFGPKKILTGIVFEIHTKNLDFEPKEIADLIDNYAVVNPQQLLFFEWMSSYYMCSLGEVMNAALPAALKLLSESFISLKPDINPYERKDLNDREFSLIEVLRTSKELPIKEVSAITGFKQPQRVIKSLVEKNYLDLFEKLSDRFIPKKIRKIRINPQYAHPKTLEVLINKLESKPKQQDVLLSYLKLLPILEDPSLNEDGIEKTMLMKEEISRSALKTLAKNGIVEEWDETVSRFPASKNQQEGTIELNDIQQRAKNEVKNLFKTKEVVLLHGITGSGKTEIYIELIKEQLKGEKQVLYLLPEIALTTQIISRLYVVFGQNFGIYHSKYSDNERVEVWNKVLNKEFQFVVGVRSSVFLPFSNLGLVIIDEEHESSYKQYDPAPRYHARDAAIYLAIKQNAKVLLGTATPALETYQNALNNKYGLVELTARYGDAFSPKIQFADLRKERKQNKLKGNFSAELFKAIEDALSRQEQIIVFQNRRGYALHVACDSCGNIPKCPNCSVSLTYHQFNNKLICHYCGYNQSMFSDCIRCGNKELRNVGFGTEEIEEEVKTLFPDAAVQRMDLDTTRSKYSYQQIIMAFEKGEIDILVGTQMVSKGLDFDRVTLVGVLDTDRLIHFPHFRAHEKAFQLITQVSGRAGRRSKNGKVIIQTSDPMQKILSYISSDDYLNFYKNESYERERFRFPPTNRLIRVIFMHPAKEIAYQGGLFFINEIKKELGSRRVDGPIEPIVSKIRNRYHFEAYIRIEKEGISISSVKAYLWTVEKMTKKNATFRGLGVIFDIDPI